jgi:hypothetical protein
VDYVPLVVAHHLDLHMARAGEELLEVERTVPEGLLGLLSGDAHRLAELLLVFGYPDAPAAPPCRRLHHDRVADHFGRLHRVVV